MAKKEYDWEDGALLQEHTKKKHDILKKYFRQYLLTRCQLPQQEKFRLVVVDGFSGAGTYQCGAFGSPIIFVEELVNATNEINIYRASNGIRPIQIECLLLLNDLNKSAIHQLKQTIAPHIAASRDRCQNLFIETEFSCEKFEESYWKMKKRILAGKCRNVLFNLDQCGYSHVTSQIIRDIITSWRSAEVILTFMIDSMLAYLSPKKDEVGSNVPLEPKMQRKIDELLDGENLFNKNQWLGEAEKIAYSHLKECATYVSPFSINNPNGWRYWLMHFANEYRARQVYNDILHQDDVSQAHFGRSGLNMLSYDPKENGQLYLFNNDSRKLAKEALYDDIPRFVAESGDALNMQNFYSSVYSETPSV